MNSAIAVLVRRMGSVMLPVFTLVTAPPLRCTFCSLTLSSQTVQTMARRRACLIRSILELQHPMLMCSKLGGRRLLASLVGCLSLWMATGDAHAGPVEQIVDVAFGAGASSVLVARYKEGGGGLLL